MKKLYIILILWTGFYNMAFGQCTPNANIGNALMSPEKLEDAMIGYYYSQAITFRVPADSMIDYNGTPVQATIDSMKMLAILGIPPGYSYACNNNRCTWAGGTLGCALIEGLIGIPDSSKVGEYQIKMYVQTWGRVGPTIKLNRVDSSSGYTFKVVNYNGIFEISKTTPLHVYPNPSNGHFKIELRDIQSDDNLIQVMDITGKVVFEKSFGKPDQFLSAEEVILPSQANTLYMVRLQSGDKVMQQKVVVN